MFKLVIADDEGKTTTVPLVRDEITIGRKEGNTIRLTDRNVSRRHARLQKQNGNYLLQDLGSYNGIVINGARLSDARPLRHGDQILIGDYKLAITEEAQSGVAAHAGPVSNGAAETLSEAPTVDTGPKLHPAPTAPGIPSAKVTNGVPAGAPPPVPQATAAAPITQQPVPARTSSPPPAPAAVGGGATHALTLPPPTDMPEDLRQLRLVFLSPAGVPPPVVLERLPLILGRSEAADIALPFPSISREHARLFAEDGQLMIEDMGSSNGILINGEKQPKTRITPGDLVTLGVVEFRVARRGDSTMVVHREAEAQKVAIARRSPLPVIGGVLGGGIVLGLIIIVMMHNGATPRTEVPAPTVISPPPAVTPVPVPVPAVDPNNAAVPAAPVEPTEPAPTVAPPEPVHPAAVQPVAPPTVAEAPTPPDPVEPVAPVHVHASETASAAVHPAAHPVAHHASENVVVSAPSTPLPASTHVASASSSASSNTSSPTSAAAPPADLLTQARLASGHDNPMVVHLLEGHATTEPELGLLAVTYRQMGNRQAAERTMRRYLTRFPNGPRGESFHDYLDAE